MTEITMSSQIIEILNDPSNRFGIAIDWTNKTVMPYVMELMNKFITYSIIKDSAIFVSMAVGLLVGIICRKKIIEIMESWIDETFTRFLYCVAIAILFMIMLHFGFNVIKCITMPELCIYDYIRTMTGG